MATNGVAVMGNEVTPVSVIGDAHSGVGSHMFDANDVPNVSEVAKSADTRVVWVQPATLVYTTLVVHTCDSIMCRLFAHNNGYPKNLWTVLGFVFGIWAIAVLILLPRRKKT